VPQRQSENGHHQHQTCGHEFFGLHQAHGEHNQQSRQENVCHIRLKYYAGSAKAKSGGERDGHDQRNFAFRFEKTYQHAKLEQEDVNPEDLFWVHNFFAEKLAATERKEHKEMRED
jgi:hypothetical protein